MFRVSKLLLIAFFVLMLTACANQLGNSSIYRDTDDQTSLEDGNRSPLDPIPGEEDMSRGTIIISKSALLIMESYPLQIVLEIEGELPSPCHNLRAEVSEPDKQGRIKVELYSLSDPDMICIQVLEPFETKLTLGSFLDGNYTVWLNGEQVGEFTQ